MSNGGKNKSEMGADMKLLLEAMRRMMRAELEPLQERLDQFENTRQDDNPRDDDEREDNDDRSSNVTRRRWHRETRNHEDSNLNGIKMKILPFQGKSDPEVYLEWEKKVEFIFDCHNYSEEKKNVKNAGLPMPGEEQEDTVMTSTQGNLLNHACPISGKPQLSEPVHSMDSSIYMIRRQSWDT